MLSKNIKTLRKAKGLSQEELAVKLNVVRQTISKWEQDLSVPDADMLIHLANELDTSVSVLLGDTLVDDSKNDKDLKVLSEKLEAINLQLAKRNETRIRMIRYILMVICILIILGFIMIALTSNEFMTWNYNNPELAVAGTILHGMSWIFVRIAPFMFIAAVIGIVLTNKRRS
ncbi:putative transcriptional regulator [Faecalicoccus acidiformans]|uniref:Putative transcriptional regulator n=1 Tax=Faecalicoccus acidiformans TaxID=915173 RepID=A0A7W8D0D8_9FIRM|nr:helix-turn-helix transcriptional regulator [Faecalicoccus acidiformans]MBB5184917.1 putative transcriptional regulator [Faecalicoccus acidiformans]